MSTLSRRAFTGVVASLCLATTANAATAGQPKATRSAAPPPSLPQQGTASWYGGPRWHGKRTASGAVYDENAHTAAHATLPIGSRIRVVVADTGRSVVVTINDRPGTRKRIIDLSRGAAVALGIIQRGVAPVTLLPA